MPPPRHSTGAFPVAAPKIPVKTIREWTMRHLLIGAAAAVAALAVTSPLWAQVPAPVSPQPWPSAAYPVQHYPFPGASPEDAYRDGIINRWQLEQYEGPTPQALQGPNPSGNKNNPF